MCNAPKRLAFFVWIVVWSKIHTFDNLMRGYTFGK